MAETGLVSPETVADVLDTLKFDWDEFLTKVAEQLLAFLVKSLEERIYKIELIYNSTV